MVIHKFVLSLNNTEKGELLKAIADTCYKDKGKVLDYLYDLAGFIAQEPEKKQPKEIKSNPFASHHGNWKDRLRRIDPDHRTPLPMKDTIGLNAVEMEMLDQAYPNRISAIKSLRERYYGLGLKEARDLVEDHVRNGSYPSSGINLGTADEPVNEDQAILLTEYEMALLRTNTHKDKVAVIRSIRRRSDRGLGDIMNFMNEWQRIDTQNKMLRRG